MGVTGKARRAGICFGALGLFLVQLMVKYISLTSAFHREVTSSGDREGLGHLKKATLLYMFGGLQGGGSLLR